MRLVFFLLIGVLSVFFPEVLAGSAPLWFVDPWGILMVFPLYFAHLIFFLNIAVRAKRTSVGHLYLFGVLIGLYESWITKVLWTGYPGVGAPMMGTFFGVAALEFSVLVFFWHPVFAFVLPILVFETLAVSAGSEQTRILPSHRSSLRTPKLPAFLTFAALLGAAFLSLNTGHNVFLADISILGNLLIIFSLFLIARRRTTEFSISSLQLQNRGLTIVAIYLFLLYVFSFLLLVPEKIPNEPLPILAIIGFYTLVAFLIKTSPVDKTPENRSASTMDSISSRTFLSFCLLFLLLTTFFCIVPAIGAYVTLRLNFLLFVAGPFFFVFALTRVFRHGSTTTDSP